MESFADAQTWRAWLARNHATQAGVWVKMAKKGTGIASIDYAGALEHALCYGWIDGQSKGIDESWWMQKFTPRGKRSIWSKINREKVLALIESGAMQPAGLAEIERAQQDGRWDQAYDSPKNATVPEDLAAALAGKPKAAKFFTTLDATNRYAILHRIQTAKKPETRAKRIAEFVTMLAEGRKIH
ncbi:YdeI/OmpD-associated family protein [Nannocystaceae bacterium ST9]